MDLELSPKIVKLLLHIRENGYVKKDTRPFLTALRYYNYLWQLRDANLIECNGRDKENNQKIWKLTEKGKEVANKLSDIRSLVD